MKKNKEFVLKKITLEDSNIAFGPLNRPDQQLKPLLEKYCPAFDEYEHHLKCQKEQL